MGLEKLIKSINISSIKLKTDYPSDLKLSLKRLN